VSIAEIATAYLQGAADRENYTRPPRKPILVRLAQLVGRRMPNWRRLRSTAQQTTAFALADLALWHQWGMTAGLIGAAVALLVLDALSGESRSPR
jgi:hypothetical protein